MRKTAIALIALSLGVVLIARLEFGRDAHPSPVRATNSSTAETSRSTIGTTRAADQSTASSALGAPAATISADAAIVQVRARQGHPVSTAFAGFLCSSCARVEGCHATLAHADEGGVIRFSAAALSDHADAALWVAAPGWPPVVARRPTKGATTVVELSQDAVLVGRVTVDGAIPARSMDITVRGLPSFENRISRALDERVNAGGIFAGTARARVGPSGLLMIGVPHGPWTLEVVAPDGFRLLDKSEQRVRSLTVLATEAQVDLRLVTAACVRGVLVDESSDGVATNFPVFRFLRVEFRVLVNDSVKAFGSSNVAATGRFSFDVEERGTVDVDVTVLGFASRAPVGAKRLSLFIDERGADLGAVAIDLRRRVFVQVEAEDGTPIAGARTDVDGQAEVATGPDGCATLMIPYGVSEVTVAAMGYGVSEIDVRDTARTSFDCVLKAARRLKVRVDPWRDDCAGTLFVSMVRDGVTRSASAPERISGLSSVRAVPARLTWADGRRVGGVYELDMNGCCEFQGLENGETVVIAICDGWGSELFRQTLRDFGDGETVIARLEHRRRDLAFEIVDQSGTPARGASVFAGSGPLARDVEPDDGGSFILKDAFAPVPIVLTSPGHRTIRRTICDLDRLLRVEPAASLCVKIDPSTTASIDGVEFRDESGRSIKAAKQNESTFHFEGVDTDGGFVVVHSLGVEHLFAVAPSQPTIIVKIE